MANGKSDKHKNLQTTAINFLYRIGCSVFAEEVPTDNGIADALGVRTRGKSAVYYIEAKASRSDLICAKQKMVYSRSIGNINAMCYRHTHGNFPNMFGQNMNVEASKDCPACIEIRNNQGDTGIDFYYFIVADGIKLEDKLYPEWGVINEKGDIIRKAQRRKRGKDHSQSVQAIAHVLVYKLFGKLYLN